MSSIILSAAALVLVLIGIWHEEKLIAFEAELWERVKDRTLYNLAHVVVWYKNKKAGREVCHIKRR